MTSLRLSDSRSRLDLPTGECKVCRQQFIKLNSLHSICSRKCLMSIPVYNGKAAKAEKREERKALAARKRAVKTRKEWIADAQRAVNAYVRLRDVTAGHGCIDCGKAFEPQRPGGSVDAGHYLSRGSAPHLRFDERNIFAQRKNCNRPGGTTRGAFRLGVVSRIGAEAVEALESDQSSPKWTIDELKEIRDTYRAKTKALKGKE